MRYMVQWNNSELGPFDEGEINDLFRNGSLTMNTLIKTEGSDTYRSLFEMNIIDKSKTPAPSPVIPTHNYSNPTNNPYSNGIISVANEGSKSNGNANNPSIPPNSQPSQPTGNAYNPYPYSNIPAANEPSQSTGSGYNPYPYGNIPVAATSATVQPNLFVRRNLLSTAIEILMEKPLIWIVLLFCSLFFQVMLKIKQIEPVVGLFQHTGVTATPKNIIEIAILSLVSAYSSIVVLGIIIVIASCLYDGMDISIGEAFVEVNKRLPKFIVAGLTIVALGGLLFAPTLILPAECRLAADFFAFACWFALTFKLFPIPFLVLNDDLNAVDTIRASFRLTQGQFLRYFTVMIFLGFTLFGLAAISKFSFGLIAVNQGFYVFSIIMTTTLYKTMHDEAESKGYI